jgi:hypothetical protein
MIFVVFLAVITLALALISPVAALTQARTGTPGDGALAVLTTVSAMGTGGALTLVTGVTWFFGALAEGGPLFPLWLPAIGPVLTLAILAVAITAAARHATGLARLAAALPLAPGAVVLAALAYLVFSSS